MKTVYLFRHGDTVDAGSGADYSRNLTEEGRRQNDEMAVNLKEDGIKFDLFITSGALRAVETARIIAGRFEYPVTGIVTDDLLYSSNNADDILHLIQNSSEDISSIMIVGHNPLLSDFISYAGSFPSGISMGKSSSVRIDFNTGGWSLIEPHSGKVAFYKTFVKGKIVEDVTYVQQ